MAVGETVNVPTKTTHSYAPFEKALTYQWSNLRARELKRVPDTLWGLLCTFISSND